MRMNNSVPSGGYTSVAMCLCTAKYACYQLIVLRVARYISARWLGTSVLGGKIMLFGFTSVLGG